MELRIKHKTFDKTLSMIYSHWINEIVNKGEASNYIILEYPDIVQVVHIEPNGNRLNYIIADRRVAQKMIDDSPQAFELVEIDIKRQIASDIKLSVSNANKTKGKNHLSFNPFFFLLKYIKYIVPTNKLTADRQRHITIVLLMILTIIVMFYIAHLQGIF